MRATSAVSRTAIAAATLSGLVAALDASAKTNVVTYWGQGAGQDSLQTVCANPNIDIVNIAFLNVFPDQGAAGWPGTNFGNACGSETYTYNGTSTQLLSNCPDIGPDIEICQKIYNTKVFLSIGGGYPTDYYIDNDSSAANFAKFLWGTFGPSESAWTSLGGPRPFGDAVVDGFDFDIESDMSAAPVVDGTTLTNYQTNGYATMISTFKNTLFAQDTSKDYYISGAPQCIVPDAHFAAVVSVAHFDFLFVQYYNTPECSARQALSASSKRAGTGFTGYDNWASVDSFNADVMLYMGLPASTAASSDATYYLEPSEVQTLVGEIYSNSRFGGIMLWEATYAANNVICNKDYATWMKQILVAAAAGTTVDATTSPCPAQTVSKDGRCGGYNGQTCVGSIFGSCCSNLGYCGDSTEYCSISTCDTDGGDCGSQYIAVNTTSTSAVSSVAANSTSIAAIATTNSTSVAPTAAVNSTSVSASATYGAGVGLHFDSSALSVSATSVSANATSVSDVPTATSASANVTSVSGFPTATYGASAGLRFGNSTLNGTGTYPKMTAGPFSNSSGNAFGAVGLNGGYALAPSTIYETSTVYDYVTETMTYSASQGGDPTTVVTEFVTMYTTVYPVSTTTPTTSAVNFNSGYNTGSNAKAADAAAAQDVYVTKTIYSTEYFTVTSSGAASGPTTVTLTSSYAITTTVVSVASASSAAASTSSAAAAAVENVYVTKTIYSTEYFTVTSSGAASGPKTMTLTSSYAVSTKVVPTTRAKAAVKNVEVVKTIYSTEYLTVTSSGADSGPSTVTLTSVYSMYTTVVSTIQEADPTNSATTTITLSSTTTTGTTTVTATSTVTPAGVNINAGAFTFKNATSSAPYALGNATVTRMMTATIVPIPITPSASSYSPEVNGYAANAIAGSGASANGSASVEAATLESIVPVSTVVSGAAAASGVVATGSFVANAAFVTFSPKQAAVATSSGDQSRVDVGVVVLALFIGAFFAM